MKILFAFLGLLCIGFLDNLRGPFFPVILQDLQLRDDVGSLFFAVTSLFAFFSSPFFNLLHRKLSTHQMWRIGLIFSGLGFAATAIGVDIFLSAAIFGLGFGTVSIGQNLLIVENVNITQRRRLLSALHSMYGISALAAPLSAVWFMQNQWAWRNSFLLSSVVPETVIVASIFLLTGKRSKSRTQNIPSFSAHSKMVWIWAVIAACYLLAEISVSTRLVLYLYRHQSLTVIEASNYLTWFFLLLTIGRITTGVLHLPEISTVKILAVCFATTFAALVTGLVYHPIGLAISGLTMAPIYPMLMQQLSELFHDKIARVMSFIVGFGSFIVVIMHVILGVLTQNFTIQLALWIAPLGALISLLLLYWVHTAQLSKTRRR